MSIQFQIPPPLPFDFREPREWPTWCTRFQRYRSASKLDKQSPEQQINTLVYLMGERAEHILLSFALNDTEKKDYNVVLARFEDHFIIKRNKIYERARFNSRVQIPGESAETFYTSLHELAKYCEFGNLHDELICDRLVVGVLDRRLSEKLQLDKNLTLQRAYTMVRQAEEVELHREMLRTDKVEVDKVYVKDSSGVSKKLNVKKNMEIKDGKNVSKWICFKCGGDKKHGKLSCPAKDNICSNCNKLGHFYEVCQNKNVAYITKKVAYLGLMQSGSMKHWTVKLKINSIKVEFIIDTGAEVTVIAEDIYKRHFGQISLEQTKLKLFAANKIPLKPLGFFKAVLSYQDHTIVHEIYVVKGKVSSLLSLKASVDLELIKSLLMLKTPSPDFTNSKYPCEPLKEFKELFSGLGRLKDKYRIRVKPDSIPFAITTPRRIPLPLMKDCKKQLEEMVNLEVIEPVDEPSQWCAPLVVVPKPNGGLRLCVDITQLNKNVERELHPMPVVEHTLAQLAGAKFKSKLDANSGYWQIELTTDSRPFTTFMTPFGRYRFRRLPFGISSAPEHFQKRMSQAVEGLDGVICHMDDILVFGNTIEEHDHRLRKLLHRLLSKGLTLNKDKCEFLKKTIHYLGHIIDENGIYPDKEKVEAVKKMPAPTNVTELKRFLGMANYLGKFIPQLSEIAHPLTELLKSGNSWIWDAAQEEACKKLKLLLTTTPGLALFDVNKPIIISADASSYGLGAALFQDQKDGIRKPVAFASKTLTETERRYAQIEKESLAITWACEHFKNYIIGAHFLIETDHKPLVPIFTSKAMDDLTPRLQRFRIRMMRYLFTITHIPGKELIVADALSRAPLEEMGDNELEEEMSAYVQMIISDIPASDARLKEIAEEQKKDIVCRLLVKYSKEGWPSRDLLPPDLRQYWSLKEEFAEEEGLLLRGQRLVIPKSLQNEIKKRLHEGHQGITKCRRLAISSVWWPGLSTELKVMIGNCDKCIQESKNHHQPLMPSTFPNRPWQKVALDLFYINYKWHLIVTDYYSRFFEIAELSDLKAYTVIRHIKPIFARHGIPEEVMSDNGSQFQTLKNSEFAAFASEYGFRHITSSPHFPQSNGAAEAAVKVVKSLFSKEYDPLKALLAYRCTPLDNGFTPAELCMGRKLRNNVPMASRMLLPKTPDPTKVRLREEASKDKQKKNYDSHHGVHNLSELKLGQKVWIIDLRIMGLVKEKLQAPRSYLIETQTGVVRRNRFHLIPSEPGVKTVLDNRTRNKSPRETLPNGNISTPASSLYTRSGRRSSPPGWYGF